MKRERKKIRFAPFIISAVFLFNPMMGTVDILPDFIGYLIICSTLSAFCELSDYFVEARQAFLKLFYFSLARFGVSAFLLLQDTLTGDVFTLLYLFGFETINVIFAIPAFTALKKGIQYLPMHKSSLVIDKPAFRKSRLSKNEFVFVTTVVFLFIRAIFTVLPEMLLLGKTNEFGEINYALMSLYGPLRMATFFFVLTVGVIWLVLISVYFLKICKDSGFVEGLEELYLERACLTRSAILQRSINTALVLMVFSFACSIDVFVDGTSVIPSCISAMLAFFAFVSLDGVFSELKKAKIICVFSFLASIVKMVVENKFLRDFSYTQIKYNQYAKSLYVALSVANLADAILHFLVILIMLSLIKKIIKHHTGFSLDERNDSKLDELHKRLNRKTVPVYAFGIIRTLTSIFYYASKVLEGVVFELAFTYHLVACVVILAFSASLIKAVREEVSYKYMLA